MLIECWCGTSEILKSWVPILNPLPSILNFEFQNLHSPSFYLTSLLSNLNSPSSTLLPWFSAKSTGYLTENVLKIAGFPTKCPQAPLALLAAFSRSAFLRIFCFIPQLKFKMFVLLTTFLGDYCLQFTNFDTQLSWVSLLPPDPATHQHVKLYFQSSSYLFKLNPVKYAVLSLSMI